MSAAKVSAAAALSIASLAAAQPAQAASFAQSSGDFTFKNFSISPFSTDATASSSSLTAGPGSEAIADADALFTTDPAVTDLAPLATNFVTNSAFSLSGVTFATSESAIVGSFIVAPGDTLSFDFSGILELITVVNEPNDFATAALETQYVVFQEGIIPGEATAIDSFLLAGQINTPSGADFFEISGSDQVILNQVEVVDQTGPDTLAELLVVEVSGSYERLFPEAATLTLAEAKSGDASSSVQVQVPEPTGTLVWLLGMTGLFASKQLRLE